MRGEFAAAERAIDRAIDLNPNSALSHAIRGNTLVYAGRPAEAVESLELAMRLDPHPVGTWVVNLAQAYYYLGRYDAVLELFERFGREFDEDPAPHMILAATHGQLGNEEAAAREVARLRRRSPFFDAATFASHLADPAHGRMLLEGLRKAGWE